MYNTSITIIKSDKNITTNETFRKKEDNYNNDNDDDDDDFDGNNNK